MRQSNTARAEAPAPVETHEPESHTKRPVYSAKHDGVEVAVWSNHTENGTMYNTTIKNSYKDRESGEWKPTESFSPTDLAVLGGLVNQAFTAILHEKAKSRGR